MSAAQEIEDTQMANKKPAARHIVRLTDLAPQGEVLGGSQRRVFGSDPIGPTAEKERSDMKTNKTAKKSKDLPAKSPVKGGGHNLNDNLTLVRAAKPAPKRKDLPSRKDVTGGKKRE
jgi:hypothetical protein